ncbi:MAG: alpha/beta hydrolase [Bacteroidales bacterium]|nr:alpha/beta hydrolase [Bacteroidales bacterium]
MAKTSIYKTEKGKAQVQNFYEELLSDWHQPSNEILLETKYGTTFILESGIKEAPAIILLHGSGSNLAMWKADVMELSKTFHVFAVDIIGECGKSSENRPTFKNGNYLGWMNEILDKLDLKKVSVIGCSLGGWIALDFAINHPKKIDKLVLIATAGITQVKTKTILWIIVTSMFGNWGFKQLNKMVYGNLSIDSKAMEFASLIKKHFKPRTEVLPIVTDRLLQKIKAKTLFIGGENDCFYNSHKTSNRLKENLYDVKCVVLRNTGHVLLDQTKTLVQFLRN